MSRSFLATRKGDDWSHGADEVGHEDLGRGREQPVQKGADSGPGAKSQTQRQRIASFTRLGRGRRDGNEGANLVEHERMAREAALAESCGARIDRFERK